MFHIFHQKLSGIFFVVLNNIFSSVCLDDYRFIISVGVEAYRAQSLLLY